MHSHSLVQPSDSIAATRRHYRLAVPAAVAALAAWLLVSGTVSTLPGAHTLKLLVSVTLAYLGDSNG